MELSSNALNVLIKYMTINEANQYDINIISTPYYKTQVIFNRNIPAILKTLKIVYEDYRFSIDYVRPIDNKIIYISLVSEGLYHTLYYIGDDFIYLIYKGRLFALNITPQSGQLLIHYVKEHLICALCDKAINVEKKDSSLNIDAQYIENSCGCGIKCEGMKPFFKSNKIAHNECLNNYTYSCGVCKKSLLYGADHPVCSKCNILRCFDCKCTYRCADCYCNFCINDGPYMLYDKRAGERIPTEGLCQQCVDISTCCGTLQMKKSLKICNMCDKKFCYTCDNTEKLNIVYNKFNENDFKVDYGFCCDDCNKQNYKPCSNCNTVYHINELYRCFICSRGQSKFCIECVRYPYSMIDNSYKQTTNSHCLNCVKETSVPLLIAND